MHTWMHEDQFQAMLCRNNADAELQTAVAQHAAACKQQLAASTASIDQVLSKVSDEHVMSSEEAVVRQVRCCIYVKAVTVYTVVLCCSQSNSMLPLLHCTYQTLLSCTACKAFYSLMRPMNPCTCIFVSQVWSDVIQQMPVRSDAITQLGHAAEVCFAFPPYKTIHTIVLLC